GMVVVEVAGQRLAQLGDLGTHPAVVHLREDLRGALPIDHRLQHLRAGYAVQVVDNRVHLGLSVVRGLFQSLFPSLLPAHQAATVWWWRTRGPPAPAGRAWTRAVSARTRPTRPCRCQSRRPAPPVPRAPRWTPPSIRLHPRQQRKAAARGNGAGQGTEADSRA